MSNGEISSDLGSEMLPRSASIRPVQSESSGGDAELKQQRRSRLEKERSEADDSAAETGDVATHMLDHLA